MDVLSLRLESLWACRSDIGASNDCIYVHDERLSLEPRPGDAGEKRMKELVAGDGCYIHQSKWVVTP
jgi:hypothetical protein